MFAVALAIAILSAQPARAHGPKFSGETEQCQKVLLRSETRSNSKPRFILLMNTMSVQIGTGLVKWTPTLASAMASRKFSDVHVFGNIANLIPDQDGGRTKAGYVGHYLSHNLPTRTEEDRIMEELKALVESAQPGDIIVNEGPFVDEKRETKLLQIAGNKGALVISNMKFQFGNRVEEMGINYQRGIGHPNPVFQEPATDAEMASLFIDTGDADFEKRMVEALHEHFPCFDPRGAFDFVNLNAQTHGSFLLDGGGTTILKMIELRLQSSNEQIVIPPFGLSEYLSDEIGALERKFPARLIDMSNFHSQEAINFLIRKASRIITPDTSTAWIARYMRPDATFVLLFQDVDRLVAPRMMSDRQTKKILRLWVSEMGRYVSVPVRELTGNIATPPEAYDRNAARLLDLIFK